MNREFAKIKSRKQTRLRERDAIRRLTARRRHAARSRCRRPASLLTVGARAFPRRTQRSRTIPRSKRSRRSRLSPRPVTSASPVASPAPAEIIKRLKLRCRPCSRAPMLRPSTSSLPQKVRLHAHALLLNFHCVFNASVCSLNVHQPSCLTNHSLAFISPSLFIDCDVAIATCTCR